MIAEDLERIYERAAAERVTVADIEAVFQGRGAAALSLIFSLPFVQPIPVPGLSVVLGACVMVFGMRIAFGDGSARTLPDFVGRQSLKGATLRKLLGGARKHVARVERLFRCRLETLLQPPFGRITGIGMIASGLALALPLPPVIIFSNAIPAWSIIALTLGVIEKDGLFVLVGHVMAVGTWIYFACWYEVVRQSIAALLA